MACLWLDGLAYLRQNRRLAVKCAHVKPHVKYHAKYDAKYDALTAPPTANSINTPHTPYRTTTAYHRRTRRNNPLIKRGNLPVSHIILACSECAAPHKADMLTLHCAKCAAALDVAYTDTPQPRPSTTHAHAHDQGQGHANTHAMPTPLHNTPITLGEGSTPIVHIPNIGATVGASCLYAKLEMMNPTGSFKDRGSAVMMSVAKEMGVSQVVEDSSGNAGASVAAYAARAGMQAHIFAPASAPSAKLNQIAVYGAKTHLIDGDRQAVTDAAVRFAAQNNLVYASHNLSPYFTEGTKTFAYEIAAQLGANPPQNIVIPTGNGSLLIGAHRGFSELLQTGVIANIPKLHAVQARAVMPLVAAFTDETKPAPAARATIAGGIAVANPPRLRQSLHALRATGGSAVAVDEDDILQWQIPLARREGIFAEPTSAAAFAGTAALIASGAIPPDQSIVIAATGFGLKDAMPPV